MFDSIIFDVDGTLWDSTPVVESAWNKAFDEVGYNNSHVSAETLKGLFGLPMMDIIDRVAPFMNKEEKEMFAKKCYKNEHDFLYETPGSMYENIIDTIRKLAKKYKIFIVSNCQAGYIELFLDKSGLTDVITDHVCPGDTDLLKADNIRLIASRNRLKAPVYVGDTQMDADACSEADIPIIYASYGFGTVKNPYATIDTPADLLKIL